ncbi:MAG: alpha/beta fold hydrolase [Alphaproteobacteria bacterium]|nr:alpha/beta fold hydrolase [Alphaproteobacteria bacterium]
MKVKANGITFNCEIDGREGAPWVVFSNSLATNLSMWDDQAAALAKDFRVLRYDQRGHGKTDAPDGRYNFDTLVADVIGLYDALNIARAHFVGLSMGGMTAVALAEKHPGRVDRLVPCDCGPASTPQSAQQWEERIALARDKGIAALVEPTLGRWFPAEYLAANPATANKVRQMIRTTPVAGFVGCAYALSDFDLRPGLGAITTPTLFICGGKDAALPGTKALHTGVAGSAFIEVPGAGHISNLEQPQFFTKTLKDFLLKAG